MNALRNIVLAAALAIAAATTAAAAGTPAHASGLEEQVDALVRDGFEHPAQALAGLDQLQREHGGAPQD